MKSLSTLLATMLVIIASFLLFASCSHENFDKVAPTAPAEFSSAERIPAASAVDDAIWASRINKNFEQIAPTKFSSAQRLSAATLTAAPIYTVTDLGTLGGPSSFAFAINSSGQIVGTAMLANGTLHPFLYKNGQLIDLGTLGGNAGIASDINDVGEIIGQADNAQGIRRAFLYRNGVMTEIGTLGGFESRASGINASGSIIGSASTAANARHAFLYENSQMFDLGTLGGTTSWANEINTSGQIVGGSHTPPDERWHAYLRDHGVMTDLGTLGGRQSVAFDLNDAGQVVGWSDVAGTGPFHAVLWNNGVITDLGTFSGQSLASAINNSGQVVGYSYTAENRQHAFLHSSGVMQDLNNLIPADSGWELTYGSGITDDGQKIIGWGLINGQSHAFLLTLSPSLMIGNLIDLVLSFNLHKGIENSLIVKLEHAQDALAADDITGACNHLTAFINEVNAQAGKKLTLDQANQLISGANQIKTALGCQ
ncbi:MAG: hypothetical protein ACRENG_03505 [bacterium]